MHESGSNESGPNDSDRSSSEANRPAARNSSCGRQPNKAFNGLALALSIAGGGLIWYKLRVVTGVPRQAIAEPEHRATNPPNAAQPEASTQADQTPESQAASNARRDSDAKAPGTADPSGPDRALPR
jgi:hypothetical protein